MRRPVFCMALVFFFMVLLSGSFSAFADGLIVHNGATLTLNGSTIDLNCLDLTIESGGTFDFASGIVTECGNLIVDVGGSLIEGTGTMYYCNAPLPPTATTQAATVVGATTATLNGTVNANDGSTTVTFQYGLTTAYGSTVTADQSPVTGSTGTAVSAGITGLDPGTTYHFRVVAQNAVGTTYGSDLSFTTTATAAIPPTATTQAATVVGATTATLNGTVNANSTSTTVTFQYGTSTSYSRTTDANPNTVAGSSDTAVNITVSDLSPNMTYHYRVVAVNAGGTAYGADMTFTTGSGPAVTTEPASGVGISTATLNGIVNANNNSTTVTFEYGLTTAYGITVTADQSPVIGATDTAVSKALNFLPPSTTYHYRVVGQNSGGTTYGADMTFTTGAAHSDAPVATTTAATGVGPTGATLTGTVQAKNQSTVVTFEYGTDTSYGTTVTADQSPVASEFSMPVSRAITGLTPSITYHYRVVAQNAYGTSYGADMTFFTATPVITAVTDPASNVRATTATLNATVNAAGNFVSVEFEYGLTAVYGSTVSGTPNSVFSSTDTTITGSLTGLTPGNTYHYRVVVKDAFPPNDPLQYGADMTFITTVLPTAVTNAATAVGTTIATLNGTINSNNGSTSVTFEYGETLAYGRTLPSVPATVTGSSDTAVSGYLIGLIPNTIYHYRVVAQKALETVYGADMTFTTSGLPPTADTNAATAVTTSGATLNGTVNANNDSTTVTFEYGLTTAYGSTVTADQSPVIGAINTAVSYAVTGLTADTTYHYRVVAQNGSGTTYGADMTFFTGIAPPAVTTGGVTNIGPDSATLHGTVNANNGSTTVTFEYGTTIGYGRTATADQSPVTDSADTSVSVNIDSLNSNTLYHYRVCAQNSAGMTCGADLTFTTNPAGTPVVTTANVTDISSIWATGGGNVIDEGDAPVTSRGICWSTSPNPTIGDPITSDGTGPGAFTSSLTGLSPLTIYYVRAYATNTAGTAYGNQVSFSTEALVTISGTVTDGINPIQGATITFSHDGHTETTAIDGTYSYTVSYNTTTTITPTHPGYSSWSPANRTINNISSDQPNQDFASTSDTDGVPTEEESGPDGTNPNYDGNGDGIPDSNQSNVGSFHTADGINYVTLAAPDGTQLSGVQALPAPAPGTFSDLISFPYGLFRFTVNGITPGGSVQVELILPAGASVDSYWKYGREPSNTTVHPYQFRHSGGIGAQIMGNTVVLNFIDGQRGDDDLNGANGIIVDDGGPASTTPVIPALSKEGMAVFMILLLLLACLMIRRRKLFKE